jgi:hypothetical protein
MKKLLAASALALALVAGIQQPASAWCHFKFGVGLNMEFSSGNNNLLWGLHKSGQVPDNMGGPMGGEFYAPAPSPYSAPYAGASYPAQASTQMAAYGSSYPAYYAGNYYPAAYPANYTQPSSYYQLANYPSNYAANYYLMSYPHSAGGINFYGN